MHGAGLFWLAHGYKLAFARWSLHKCTHKKRTCKHLKHSQRVGRQESPHCVPEQDPHSLPHSFRGWVLPSCDTRPEGLGAPMTTAPSPASGQATLAQCRHSAGPAAGTGVCPLRPGKSGKRVQPLCFIWEGEGDMTGIAWPLPPTHRQASSPERLLRGEILDVSPPLNANGLCDRGQVISQ